MAIKQITDTLVQITKFGVMNSYLVKEDDGFTVIDTGIAGVEKNDHRSGCPTRATH